MGFVWDYFFGSITATASVNRVQNDEPATQQVQPKNDPHVNYERSASGADAKPKGQRHVKVLEKDVDRSKSDKSGSGKQPSEKVKNAVAASSVIGADFKEESSSNPKHSMDDDSSPRNHGSQDDHLYRDCGHVRTKRDDLNLPDNIDQSQLEPVHSHFSECFELKTAYDKCFQHWFTYEFLHGATNLQPCDDLMDKYTSCVKKGLKDHKINLYPENCLYHSSDPNMQRTHGPRTNPPPGAEVHRG